MANKQGSKLLNVLYIAIFTLQTLLVDIWQSLFTKRHAEVIDFQDKSVVVSGCDSGFGYWLARKLLEHKINVFAGCLTEEGETELQRDARDDAKYLETFHLDISKQDSVDKAVEFVNDALDEKDLWAVVNNAGVAGKCMPDDFLTVNDYKSVFEVNLYGMMRMCHAFKPLLKTSKGRLINMASLAGRLVCQNMGPYCLSKHAVEIYSDLLRCELQPFGVTVHIIEPQVFRTPITTHIKSKETIDSVFSAAPKKLQDEYGKQYFAEWKQILDKIFDQDADPDYMKVVDAYFHAITAKYPKDRYRVGKDINDAIAVSFFPQTIQDYAMKMFGKIDKSNLFPLACQLETSETLQPTTDQLNGKCVNGKTTNA